MKRKIAICLILCFGATAGVILAASNASKALPPSDAASPSNEINVPNQPPAPRKMSQEEQVLDTSGDPLPVSLLVTGVQPVAMVPGFCDCIPETTQGEEYCETVGGCDESVPGTPPREEWCSQLPTRPEGCGVCNC
jgi:hypothetical protein